MARAEKTRMYRFTLSKTDNNPATHQFVNDGERDYNIKFDEEVIVPEGVVERFRLAIEGTCRSNDTQELITTQHRRFSFTAEPLTD